MSQVDRGPDYDPMPEFQAIRRLFKSGGMENAKYIIAVVRPDGHTGEGWFPVYHSKCKRQDIIDALDEFFYPF